MKINIRRANKVYLDVSLEYCGTKIDIGLLNQEEAKSLAITLESAVDDLNSGWPYDETE